MSTDQASTKELVAIYLRVSTDEQAEHGVSLSAQKVRLTAFCAAQNWNIFDLYMDDGYSGKDLDRPAMQRMIRDAQENKFGHVLVLKLDRLSRRQKDTLYLIEDIFLHSKVGFHSVTESFDTTTPYGKAALGMMAVFAQLERETIVERVKMAKKEASRQGRWKGGEAPFGYIYNLVKKKLEIYPLEAIHVKKIFEMYVSGQYGFQALADILNDEKVSTRQNVLWLKSTIRQILTNPVYIGKIRHHSDIYDGHHEAILTEEIFTRAQKMIHDRYISRPVKDPDNLLTGLLFCAECGARLRFKTRQLQSGCRKHYVCYTRIGSPGMMKAEHCSLPYRHAKELNTQVINRLSTMTASEKAIDKEIKKLVKDNTDKTNTLARLLGDKETNRKRLDRWYDAFENGLLDSTALAERIKVLQTKQVAIEREISIIQSFLSQTSQLNVSAEELKKELTAFSLNWDYLTSAEQRTLISDLVSKVVIHHSAQIDIEFRV